MKTQVQKVEQSTSKKMMVSTRKNAVMPPGALALESHSYSGFPIQTKLTIGSPNDQYEREADAMADRIMRMPNETAGRPILTRTGSMIQNKCSACEHEEEHIQRKPLMMKAEGGLSVATQTLSTQLSRSKGGGSPLSSTTNSFMSNAFGTNFSHVRVHTDGKAQQMNQGLNARAFTHGSDIYFNRGQFNPDSLEGKRLLGHELTHVAQQRHRPLQKIQKQNAPARGASASAAVSAGPTINACSPTQTQQVRTVVQTALRWLDDVYRQLIDFEADVVFGTRSSNFQRIQSALLQTFHTTDWAYVQVIAGRFYHIGRMLRDPNRVTIICGGNRCGTGGGSGTISAYVNTAYQIHLCSQNPSIATFIHEMGHAVIPQVGITNLNTQRTRIRDRAYSNERVFHHLSPEEALDNAESYGLLADALFNQRTGALLPAQQDTVSANCPNRVFPMAAIARAEYAARVGWRYLQALENHVRGRPIQNLFPDDLQIVNRHLPFIQTTQQLITLKNRFSAFYQGGFIGFNHQFSCLRAGDPKCRRGIVGRAHGGTVTNNAVTLRRGAASAGLELCPAWFQLSEQDRINTVFALHMLTLGSGGLNGLQPARAFNYVGLSQAALQQHFPTPTTTSGIGHILADVRSGRRPRGPSSTRRTRTP